MLSPAKKDGVGMMLWHAGARLSVAVHLQENQMPPFHKALQQTEKACCYRDKHYEDCCRNTGNPETKSRALVLAAFRATS